MDEVAAGIVLFAFIILGAALVGSVYLATSTAMSIWNEAKEIAQSDIVVRLVIDGNSTCNFAIDGLNVTKLPVI